MVFKSWCPQNILWNSRTFQDIYSHFSRALVEKIKDISGQILEKKRNLKDIQGLTYKFFFYKQNKQNRNLLQHTKD